MGTCDRCPNPLGVHRLSWFNLDAICRSCQTQEEAHPDYGYARDVERQRVQAGDFNFVNEAEDAEIMRVGGVDRCRLDADNSGTAVGVIGPNW